MESRLVDIQTQLDKALWLWSHGTESVSHCCHHVLNRNVPIPSDWHFSIPVPWGYDVTKQVNHHLGESFQGFPSRLSSSLSLCSCHDDVSTQISARPQPNKHQLDCQPSEWPTLGTCCYSLASAVTFLWPSTFPRCEELPKTAVRFSPRKKLCARSDKHRA